MRREIDMHQSDGARIVLAFVLISYVIPAVLSTINPLSLFEWPSDRADVWAHFFFAIGCVLSGALAAGMRRKRAPRPFAHRPFPVGMLATALLATAIGTVALTGGNASWRYGGDSISDRITTGDGALIVVIAMLQPIGIILVWWLVLLRPDAWLGAGPALWLLRWSVAAAAISGINGLNTAISALFATACMVWSRPAARLLFRAHRPINRRASVIPMAVGVLILGGALAVLGMFAKTGRSVDAPWESHTSTAFLLDRHSVHFQHAMGALEIGIESRDWESFAERCSISLRQAAFRIGVLTADPSWGARPNPASLSRWTLERFAKFTLPSDRGGSSPSVIGTAALCLPPPWSFIALAVFSFLLVHLLDWFLRDCERLSFFGCLLFAYMPLRVVTDTPLELLIPFSVQFVVVGGAIALRLGQSRYHSVRQ
jgi:hypothetical protein